MKIRFLSLFLLLSIFAISCESGPETQATQDSQAPRRGTEQEYTATMQDVRVFISELNRIISARNYQNWRARLSPDLYARISSREFLAEASEMPAMKVQRITLRSAEDYFIHVVVPSRANSRVDDIEFIGRNRVIAYQNETSRTGEVIRIRLYDLERKDNSWIIIN